MKKTKDYTRKAIEKYKNKFDIIGGLTCPPGTKDRIKATGKSINEFCTGAILKELEQTEKENNK